MYIYIYIYIYIIRPGEMQKQFEDGCRGCEAGISRVRTSIYLSIYLCIFIYLSIVKTPGADSPPAVSSEGD